MKIFTDVKLNQINFLDERFYTMDDPMDPEAKFVPSVTSILEAYPKGYGLTQWLKDLGHNADQVLERAAEIGSKVHKAINILLKGEAVEWDDMTYTLEEWQYILKFEEFWKTYKPELIATEWGGASTTLGYGGTLDVICKFRDEVWLIDFKTSNAIYNQYELQVAAYRQLWNELVPEQRIEKSGIFWFKSRARGEDKRGIKIQGVGWELKEYTRDWSESLTLFNAVHLIWKHENPNAKPKNTIYPMTIKL